MEEDAGSNPVGPHRDVTGTGEMGRRGDWRRYARELALFSPPAMVAAVTERRRAGDWRGACAAARVDVNIDLRHVAARFGTEEAARIEADLRGFAPDLLRRFLPRVQGSAEGPVLLPQASIVLSRRTDPFPAPAAEEQQSTTDSARRCEPVPVLIVETPRRAVRAPQRLTLRVGAAHKLTGRWYDLPDWCWHADAVGRQTNPVGGVHGVEHVVDEVLDVLGQRTVFSDGYRFGRRVQNGIAHDPDGTDGHGCQLM